MPDSLLFALGCALVALVYGGLSSLWILRKPMGNQRVRKIAAAIQEGASAYLNRQYATIGAVGGVLFLLIGFGLKSWVTASGFAIGALLSATAGYIGMNISMRANSRTAEAANHGLNAALKVAFHGGAITGMFVVGLGLLGVAGFFACLQSMALAGSAPDLHPLVGLAFGGSLISIFALRWKRGPSSGSSRVGRDYYWLFRNTRRRYPACARSWPMAAIRANRLRIA